MTNEAKPTLLQQGEYLPLPECDATTIGLGQVWNRHSMRAYVDADRAARGAAQAAPVTEAGKMLGDLLARIHGDGGHYASEHGIEKAVADADRILAEWRAYKPAPLQQGEYLPLPGGVFRIDPGTGGSIVGYSADQMHAYTDATCAARGAAQAAPAEIDAKSFQSYAETRAYSKGYYAGKKAAQPEGGAK